MTPNRGGESKVNVEIPTRSEVKRSMMTFKKDGNGEEASCGENFLVHKLLTAEMIISHSVSPARLRVLQNLDLLSISKTI